MPPPTFPEDFLTLQGADDIAGPPAGGQWRFDVVDGGRASGATVHAVDDIAVIVDPIVAAVPVSVIIPALNEARNLPGVLARMPSDIAELIIVDGDSTDGTADLARELWPDVRIVRQNGTGKGNALAAGFWAATGDIIVMLDADGSTDPADIPRFVAALLTGADFAKGTRFMTGGGSSDITRIRRLGNRVLAGIVNRMWDVDFSDLCYGYNAFWRRYLPEVVPDCAGFEVETLMNIRVARSRLRIVEVPSFESDRVHGVSNLDARRDGMRVLRTIVAERIRPS
jgi:glycosyltransferase involved in cell wall biosynthesis